MNSFIYRKILTPRRLRIQYVSPPICDGDFSATGTSAISLLPLLKSLGPTGLVMEPWFGRYRLRWNTVPGAICYTVYKLADEVDPFSAYTIVAECIPDAFYDVDDGIYCVTAITPEGETDCGNTISTPAEPPLPPLPPYVPADPPVIPPVPSPIPPPDIPGTCGDGTPPVPLSLLKKLDTPEEICSAQSNDIVNGETDFTVPSGRIAAQWVSGSVWVDCTLKWSPVPVCSSFIRDCWFVYEGDITIISQQYGCYTCATHPPVCSPTVEVQMQADHPDGIMEANAMTIIPKDARVGETAKFVVPGADASGCDAGGAQEMKLLRTHGWLPQRSSLSIFNFAGVGTSIFCQGSGAWGAPQWNGVIDDYWNMTENQYQLVENGGAYVGNCQIIQIMIGLSIGWRWWLQIIGDYGDGPTLLWSGEKRYGEDAAGNYGRNGGCSTEGCVILI